MQRTLTLHPPQSDQRMAGTHPYQLEVIPAISSISATAWNGLLTQDASPFLKHEFLNALEQTACVGGNTGWQVAHLILKAGVQIVGAMPLYLKYHSYGEYVFDWSWAQAYEQNGLNYYPKALCAIPFSPVQGARILCQPSNNQAEIRDILIAGLKDLVNQNTLSSAHILFPQHEESIFLKDQGFLLRDVVQFHWKNHNYENFDDFLSNLVMKRRKNIRRERQYIANAGIDFRHLSGLSITDADWDFFYRCYENTYLEHGSTPYLNQAFFIELNKTCPENIHLVIAEENQTPIASSLTIIDKADSRAYGRYWGAIKYIPMLHFETAYYQVIDYCIQNQIQVFEGGAQGEHKMARGFTPTTIQSAHFIADTRFSRAVEDFLKREHAGMAAYVTELENHGPLKPKGQTPDL